MNPSTSREPRRKACPESEDRQERRKLRHKERKRRIQVRRACIAFSAITIVLALAGVLIALYRMNIYRNSVSEVVPVVVENKNINCSEILNSKTDNSHIDEQTLKKCENEYEEIAVYEDIEESSSTHLPALSAEKEIEEKITEPTEPTEIYEYDIFEDAEDMKNETSVLNNEGITWDSTLETEASKIRQLRQHDTTMRRSRPRAVSVPRTRLQKLRSMNRQRYRMGESSHPPPPPHLRPPHPKNYGRTDGPQTYRYPKEAESIQDIIDFFNAHPPDKELPIPQSRSRYRGSFSAQPPPRRTRNNFNNFDNGPIPPFRPSPEDPTPIIETTDTDVLEALKFLQKRPVDNSQRQQQFQHQAITEPLPRIIHEYPPELIISKSSHSFGGPVQHVKNNQGLYFGEKKDSRHVVMDVYQHPTQGDGVGLHTGQDHGFGTANNGNNKVLLNMRFHDKTPFKQSGKYYVHHTDKNDDFGIGEQTDDLRNILQAFGPHYDDISIKLR